MYTEVGLLIRIRLVFNSRNFTVLYSPDIVDYIAAIGKANGERARTRVAAACLIGFGSK